MVNRPADASQNRAITRRAATGLIASAALLAAARPGFGAPKVADRHSLLSRGFNLPGWVDAHNGVAPSPAVLIALRALGFSSVRLPIDTDDWTGDASIRAAAARSVETALTELTAAGFAVMLDFHPSAGLAAAFEKTPGDADNAVVAAWRELAALVSTFSADAVFPELLNEPPLERDHWLPLRDRLAETIRKSCPDHTLVWGANRYQGIGETIDFPLLADDNAIVAVHYYTPMGFTHQCADWDGSALARLSNLPFPASRQTPEVAALRDRFASSGDIEAATLLDTEFSEPWTVARIDDAFKSFARWSEAVQCPVVLNEFGVLNFCVDPTSRTNWVRAVRSAAEKNGMGWTYWELDQGFGFLKDRQSADGFDIALVDALTLG